MAEDPSLTGVIGVIVLFSCYLMPAIIALLRGMRGAGSVALVNAKVEVCATAPGMLVTQ